MNCELIISSLFYRLSAVIHIYMDDDGQCLQSYQIARLNIARLFSLSSISVPPSLLRNEINCDIRLSILLLMSGAI